MSPRKTGDDSEREDDGNRGIPNQRYTADSNDEMSVPNQRSMKPSGARLR
jgi:hypothetical protein